jgi:hypothetical protein
MDSEPESMLFGALVGQRYDLTERSSPQRRRPSYVVLAIGVVIASLLAAALI